MEEKLETFDVCILGSGPSAVATLLAIIGANNDLKVCIVDRGRGPSESTKSFVSKLKLSDPTKWDLSSFFLGGKQMAGNPKKLFFGDNYPYRTDSRSYSTPLESQSLGGFSEIWGATVFPYILQDLKDVENEIGTNLIESYLEVAKILGLVSTATEQGELKRILPWLANHIEFIREKGDRKSKLSFSRKNIIEVPSILAFDSYSCIKCGICQMGCPFDLIWSARHTLSENHNKFTYFAGEFLTSTKFGHIEKVFVQTESGKLEIHTKSVALCGGAVGNACAAIQSFKEINNVELSDSQTRIIAGLNVFSKRIRHSQSGDSLADGFIFEIGKGGSIRNCAQIYWESTFLKEKSKSESKFLKIMPRQIFELIMKNFFAAFLYSDSESSGKLRVDTDSSIRVSATFPLRRRIRNWIMTLRFKFRLLSLGFIPIPFASRKLEVGEGNHIGVAEITSERGFSISENFFETGRISEERNVYAFGTFSLPRLAPGPITFTSMATVFAQVRSCKGILSVTT